jgi:hypothetical protein
MAVRGVSILLSKIHTLLLRRNSGRYGALQIHLKIFCQCFPNRYTNSLTPPPSHFFFPTPPIKQKLGLQVGGRLVTTR